MNMYLMEVAEVEVLDFQWYQIWNVLIESLEEFLTSERRISVLQ